MSNPSASPGDWTNEVELRLGDIEYEIGMINKKIIIASALAGTSLLLGLASASLITKISKALPVIMQQLQAVGPAYAPGYQPPTQDPSAFQDVIKSHDDPIDETKIPYTGEVAKPSLSPEMEASERTRKLIEDDAIQPKDLIEGGIE